MVALVITRGWARIGGRHLTTAWGKLELSSAVLMEIDGEYECMFSVM